MVTVASPSKAGVLSLLSNLLKNPSLAVFAGLVGVISLSWLYVLTGAGMETSGVGMTDLMSDTGTPAAWTSWLGWSAVANGGAAGCRLLSAAPAAATGWL